MTDVLTTEALSFADTIRRRHAVRAYLPEPLDDSVIRAVLEDAQTAPSNSNTQPWMLHVASGAKRDELSEALVRDVKAGRTSLDYSFDKNYGGVPRMLAGAAEVGRMMYDALDITRDNLEARNALMLRNFEFYGAPHVAFLFIPPIGDGVRTAVDAAMFAQTFVLSLFSRGLGAVSLTVLGLFADTVREVLGVSAEDNKLLFGIAFGHPDHDAAANSFKAPRAPIETNSVLHR
jgi:nitroreductase